MLVQLDNPKILSDAISIVSELVSEVKIKILEEGFSIVAVDPANISMVILKVPKESFSKYEHGNNVWGVGLDDLKKILKRASASSSVIMEEDGTQLKISIFDKIKRNFVLSLIDVDSEDRAEPDLNFTCEAEMNSQEFSQTIDDCLVVSDSCSINISNNKLSIEGRGNLNSSKVEFDSETAKISGEGRSKYSLEYLSKFSKSKIISDKVVLRFSDDTPIRLDFAGSKMGIGFILAPRVESD